MLTIDYFKWLISITTINNTDNCICFDMFFSNIINNIPNKVKRKVAPSLRKLKGEGTPSEVKKKYLVRF